ncbi:MAG: M81 family metallopeptidase [Victivallales bacterium]
MKIAIAGINQETCSFNVVETTLQDFKDSYFKQGTDAVNTASNDGVIGGFIAAMKSENCLLEGIVAARSMPGGTLSSETFASLKHMLLSGLRKVGRVDAVFLALHGAMASADEFDTEGVIVEEVRKLVGKDCFIGVALDHHANVTRKMVAVADVMVGYETQPHDLPAAGAKTARVMLDIWKNKRMPHAALVKVPMLAPQDNFLTSVGPMKEWFDLAREIEKDGDVIAVSTFPTQPWLDAPDNGWSCLVYADSSEKAQSCAEKLARKAWSLREQFWRSERLPLPAAIATANAESKGLVVISDTGDATFGGAPGDNMSIIAEMLKHDLHGAALVPVVDPAALEQSIKAGTGREITLQLGGKMSAGFSPSLKITGVIKAIAEAGNLDLGDGSTSKVGRSVLFERGNLKIAILEFRDFAINHPSLYQKLGLDVGEAQMVVLKTGSNFQYFKKYQSCLIRADSPGATQSDLTAFKWENITRPIYPFDNIKNWRA